jgi:hypothetical protein
MDRTARTVSATCRRLAWAGALSAGIVAGGCCGPLTSLRYGSSGPVQEAVTAAAGCPEVGGPADAACAVPPEGYCGADRCPTLLVWSRPHLCRLLGPIAAWRGPQTPVDDTLQPPHSRFHPVPTAPVFAQRDTYDLPMGTTQAPRNTQAPMTKHQ